MKLTCVLIQKLFDQTVFFPCSVRSRKSFRIYCQIWRLKPNFRMRGSRKGKETSAKIKQSFIYSSFTLIWPLVNSQNNQLSKLLLRDGQEESQRCSGRYSQGCGASGPWFYRWGSLARTTRSMWFHIFSIGVKFGSSENTVNSCLCSLNNARTLRLVWDVEMSCLKMLSFWVKAIAM